MLRKPKLGWCGLAALAFVICSFLPSSGSAAAYRNSGKPQGLNNFYLAPLNNGRVSKGEVGYSTTLDLFGASTYKGYTIKGGVPWVRVVITVTTPGATIDQTRSKILRGAFASHYPAGPKSNYTFKILPGSPVRAVWVYQHLHDYPKPSWVIWVKLPAEQQQVCVKGVASFSVAAPWQPLSSVCLPASS